MDQSSRSFLGTRKRKIYNVFQKAKFFGNFSSNKKNLGDILYFHHVFSTIDPSFRLFCSYCNCVVRIISSSMDIVKSRSNESNACLEEKPLIISNMHMDLNPLQPFPDTDDRRGVVFPEHCEISLSLPKDIFNVIRCFGSLQLAEKQFGGQLLLSESIQFVFRTNHIQTSEISDLNKTGSKIYFEFHRNFSSIWSDH